MCVLRLVTGRRLIPFKGEWGRLTVNTLLTGILAVLVTVSLSMPVSPVVMYALATGVLALLLGFNARPAFELVRDAKRLLRGK